MPLYINGELQGEDTMNDRPPYNKQTNTVANGGISKPPQGQPSPIVHGVRHATQNPLTIHPKQQPYFINDIKSCRECVHMGKMNREVLVPC